MIARQNVYKCGCLLDFDLCAAKVKNKININLKITTNSRDFCFSGELINIKNAAYYDKRWCLAEHRGKS